MVFGVRYDIVGRVDSGNYARCERLAHALHRAMDTHTQDITLTPVHPSDWASTYAAVCQHYGFTEFAAEQARIGASNDVLVYNSLTGRLVGGEKAFRKAVADKYAIECDVSWGLLQSIARENLATHESRTAASAGTTHRAVAPVAVQAAASAPIGISAESEVPAEVLKAAPASPVTMVEEKRASGRQNVPVASAAGSADVPPVNEKRASGSKPAAPVAAQEEVVLHRRNSKQRASGTNNAVIAQAAADVPAGVAKAEPAVTVADAKDDE